MSADTHIRCRFCGIWCGNVDADGIPHGWWELYDRDTTDPDRQVIGWVDEHDCLDGNRVRLVAPAGKHLQGTVRPTPHPTGEHFA